MPPDSFVIAIAAIERVIACAAIDGIVTAEAVDHIVAAHWGGGGRGSVGGAPPFGVDEVDKRLIRRSSSAALVPVCVAETARLGLDDAPR